MDNNRMQDYHGGISDELLAAFLDGNVSGEEMEAVAEALADDKLLAEMMSLSPVIDREIVQEQMRILPMNALAAANPDNLCSFECEAFILKHYDFDIDHWSLLETAKANNWVREEGTPLHHVGRLLELKGLHVERKYDSTLADIETALDQGYDVIAIVDKNLLKGELPSASASPQYHAIYMTWVEEAADDIEYLNLETLLDEGVERDNFLKAWNCSSNYMIKISKAVACYNPQPINVEDIDLDADLEDLTEAIAENAHDIWARARMDEGWTYGPVRDDVRKFHPDLVPYAQLPESEKEYDRIMVMNTLRLVRRLGFDIIKK